MKQPENSIEARVDRIVQEDAICQNSVGSQPVKQEEQKEEHSDQSEGKHRKVDDVKPPLLAKIMANAATLLLLFSLSAGGFIFYQTTYSDWINETKQNNLAAQIQSNDEWKQGGEEASHTLTAQQDKGDETFDVGIGKPFSTLKIPSLGIDKVIVEGVGQPELAQGPAHFPESALPGHKGNFSLAGHRIGQGAPFNKIGDLKTCDPIEVETAHKIYTYKVVGDGDCFSQADKKSVEGYNLKPVNIVKPTDIGVVDNKPWVESQGEESTGQDGQAKIMTLVTCNPEWGNWERMIVHAQLTEVKEK